MGEKNHKEIKKSPSKKEKNEVIGDIDLGTVKKKRGRKKKQDVLLMEQMLEESKKKSKEKEETKEYVIIKLPITEKDVMGKNDLKEEDISGIFYDEKMDALENKLLKSNGHMKDLEKENKLLNKMLSDVDSTDGLDYKIAHKCDINIVDESGQKLKEKTDIICYWDKNKFDNCPIAIPLFYHNNTYHTYGNFCSFNCALSYLLDNKQYGVDEHISMLKQLYRDMFGKRDEIKPAPHYKILKEWNGILTIDEFRSNAILINKNFTYFVPPMKSTVPVIEETIIRENNNEISNINKELNMIIKKKKKEKKSLSSIMGF